MKNHINNACPVCSCKDVQMFMEIKRVPVYCNVLYRTREEALRAPAGIIELMFCNSCGHVYNRAFNHELMNYSQEYENTLDFSPRFREYIQSLAGYLIDKYDLHEKTIIEIACGKGDFLSLLCEMGGNRGIGFDPSYVPERPSNYNTEGRITFIQDYYSQRYSDYKGDFICCRHALEHIQFPDKFMDDIRQSIGKQGDVAVFFEVPNVLYTLYDLGIWDLIYEHCSYFSKHSLGCLFARCGFEVNCLFDAFDGQYLCIEARPQIDQSLQTLPDFYDEQANISECIKVFAKTYYDKVSSWRSFIAKSSMKEKKPVVWGAGSKGVTFLNTLDLQNQIDYIIDINPHKHGKYVAGTGQQVMPPEFLQTYNPDSVIVVNPIYLDEIKRIVKEMNVNCEFIVA